MLWEEPPALLGGGERERQGVGPRGDVAALYWRLSRQLVGSTQGENRKHAAYSGNKEPPPPPRPAGNTQALVWLQLKAWGRKRGTDGITECSGETRADSPPPVQTPQ